ncbi:MAG TPA: hypothetical protein VD967_01775, partial [Candidatus Paceibacterota bacterium]|nr:hypothetical protein [Candidatus Paceibacterota bacterium]
SFVSVPLGSIPYTGVGDTLLTYLFLFGLLGLSATLSYGMVYAGGGSRSFQAFQPLVSMGDEMTRILLSVGAAVKPFADLLNPFTPLPRAAMANAAPLSVAEVEPISAPVEEEAPAPVALALRKDAEASETGVDLVSQIRTLTKAPAAAPEVSVGMSREEKTRVLEMLVSYAREKEILLSEDAAALILSAADGKADQAQGILSELTEVAHAWYEKPEYSWLSLSATRVREMLFSTYLSMVPMFVRWLAAGNAAKSSALLRMLDAQGHSVSEFLKGVAYELDKVHRFRSAREAGAHEHSLSATSGWSRETLESAITALIGSGDESYSSPLLGARLAVSRVMDMASRENRKELLEA